MTREAQKQRSMITKRPYNNFSALENEVECSICNNFGHEDSECRSRFQERKEQEGKKEQATSTKTWRIKEPQTERCGIAFYAEGQEKLMENHTCVHNKKSDRFPRSVYCSESLIVKLFAMSSGPRQRDAACFVLAESRSGDLPQLWVLE